MAGELELDDDVLVVMGKSEGFKRIETPDWLNPVAFLHIVSTIHTLYMRDGHVPSVDHCHKLWPKISKETFAKAYTDESVVEALRYRGVELNAESGLTLEQQYAIIKMSDPHDRRTMAAKLKEMKISSSTWHTWMKQPLFKQHYVDRAESIFADAVQPTMTAIAGAAMGGDLAAGKLVLAMTGRYRENDQAQQDAKLVILAVIEAVVRRVADPKIRSEILADVQQHVVGYDVTHQNSLEK